MKRIVVAALFSVLLAGCGDSANNQHPSSQYEEKKVSLKEMETGSPLKFLKVKGSFRGNLVNQTVVEGTITNHATLVSYKNMHLLLLFKDKDGEVIEKDKEVIDDVVKPGTTTDFKIKMGHVKGASTILIDITAATVD